MGKPTICIGENKDADQLRGNREADQRLCFRYSDSTVPLLPKSKISRFQLFSVTVQVGLCRTCSETVQVGLCRTCSETTLLVFPRGSSYCVTSSTMLLLVSPRMCCLWSQFSTRIVITSLNGVKRCTFDIVKVSTLAQFRCGDSPVFLEILSTMLTNGDFTQFYMG